MDDELLQLICCPETHQSLRPLEPAALEELNRKIAAGVARNRAGRVLSEKLAGGLLRADGKLVYPVRADIPVLLVEDGIPLD